MNIEGPAKWLRIYIGNSDQWHHKPLHLALVELFHQEGLAGATVLHGVEGFGANSRIHTMRILRLSQDLPVIVEVIDRADRIEAVLPKGIELEYDGRYTAMFCYKAKNYALYDGTKLTIRGSALRSRGIEPYLKKISDRLIRFLVGAEAESPLVLVEDFRKRIAERSASVEELAKSEVLGMNPDAYERFIADGGKPRRASAEAALQLAQRPRMGERVAYYITAKAKGKTSDWQRAKPVALYDAVGAPYDPKYYLDKLDDWIERYGVFLGASVPKAQGELSLE